MVKCDLHHLEAVFVFGEQRRSGHLSGWRMATKADAECDKRGGLGDIW
jgi:hypothetical protein